MKFELREERLPGEDAAMSDDGTDGWTDVKIILTSRHKAMTAVYPDVTLYGHDGEGRAMPEAFSDDEEFPEGYSPDTVADFGVDYGDPESDSDGPGAGYDDFYDSPDFEDIDDIMNRFFEKLAEREKEEKDEEDDSMVFRTIGKMRRNADGAIEIMYDEDASMDATQTVITVTDPEKNNGKNRISVVHTGGVFTGLICEEKVRHICVYRTPIATFEAAVYAKKCSAEIDEKRGGTIELDYLVELRGMDVQHTKMTIDVIVLQ